MLARTPREKHLIAFLLFVFLFARLLTWRARDEAVSTIFASLHVLAHEVVDFRVRRGICQSIEAAMFGQLLRGAHEAAPSRAGERPTDTDAPHTERGDIRHR
jgi:hypothetical protein